MTDTVSEAIRLAKPVTQAGRLLLAGNANDARKEVATMWPMIKRNSSVKPFAKKRRAEYMLLHHLFNRAPSMAGYVQEKAVEHLVKHGRRGITKQAACKALGVKLKKGIKE